MEAHTYVSCLVRTLSAYKSEDISVTGCEMLRIPQCLGNQLTDGDVVVSLTHRPRSTPPIHLYPCLWYSFMLEAQLTPLSSAAGRIRQIEHLQ
jgi:hypothetical protein